MKLHNKEPHPNPPPKFAQRGEPPHATSLRLRGGNKNLVPPPRKRGRGLGGWGKILCSFT